MLAMNSVHQVSAKQAPIHRKCKDWFAPVLVFQAEQLLFEGMGLHPGAVTGYFFVDATNIAHVKNDINGSMEKFPLIL